MIKDSSDLIKAVQAPRVAAALVIGGLCTLWFVEELRMLADSLAVPAWTLVAGGSLVFIGVGVLTVEFVMLTSAAALPKLASMRQQRAHAVATRRSSRADAEQAAATLENRVRDLTVHERAFLDLFAPGSQTARRMEEELLPRDIYGAVHGLISAGVLERVVRRDDPQYTERFRVASAAVGLVQTYVLKQPLGRQEVTLDLSRVQCTGASGGGAQGGRW